MIPLVLGCKQVVLVGDHQVRCATNGDVQTTNAWDPSNSGPLS